MKLIARNINGIMLVSGLITSTMLLAAFAPDLALRMMFGDSLVDPLANIIVRSWGILIGLTGIMLIYGAFNSHLRKPVLVFATLSKVAFISLMLIFGSQYLVKAGMTLAFDFLVVVVFVLYLVGENRTQDAA